MAWINGRPGPLTFAQAKQNAQMLVNGLYGKNGWTKKSISALLGNAMVESSVNPSRHEIGGGGYGLLQWTPMAKLTNWCNSQGLNYTSGQAQLAMINHEVNSNLQWIPGRAQAYTPYTSYTGSYKDFRQNKHKLSLNQLTSAFMWDYEGPRQDAAVNSIGLRQKYALDFYQQLTWNGKPGGDPGGDAGDSGQPPADGSHEETVKVMTKDPVKIFKALADSISRNTYWQNNDLMYKNFFVKLKKVLDNVYQVRLNFDFDNISLQDINTLFDLWHDETVTVPGDKPSDGSGSGTGGGTPSKKGYFWPFPSEKLILTSPMGPRGGFYHQGIDIVDGDNPTAWGRPIYAIHSGTVLVAGDAPALSGWGEAGSMIIIKNDDKAGKIVTYEEYAPGTNKVKKGQHVNGGQIIATSGVSGNSTGVHLHLGISNPTTIYNVIPPARAGVGWLDPSPYIGIKNKEGTYTRPNTINKGG